MTVWCMLRHYMLLLNAYAETHGKLMSVAQKSATAVATAPTSTKSSLG